MTSLSRQLLISSNDEVLNEVITYKVVTDLVQHQYLL